MDSRSEETESGRIQELKLQRKNLRAQVTRMDRFVKTSDLADFSLEALRGRLEILQEDWTILRRVQHELMAYVEPEAEEQVLDENFAYEDRFIGTQSILQNAISKLERGTAPYPLSAVDSDDSSHNFTLIERLIKSQEELFAKFANVKLDSGVTRQVKLLPIADLPSFDGDLTMWPNFCDLFRHQVDSKNVSGAQKLYALQKCLRGPALDCVKSFTLADANYELAWEKLNKTYDKPKVILNALISRFFRQKQVKDDSASQIRQLASASDDIIRSIKGLGEEYETRDPWLIFHLLERLDDKTKELWAQKTLEIPFPTFEDLLKFLDERVDALEAFMGSSVSKSSSSSKSSLAIKTNYTVTRNHAECANCQGRHEIHSCQKFKNLTTEERRKFVLNGKLCFNCIKPSHISQQCKSKSSCRVCNQRHHTMLHIDEKAGKNSLMAIGSENPQTSMESQGILPSITSNLSSSGLQRSALATVVVYVNDSSGKYQEVRAMLDSGSTHSIISESCFKRLGLRRRHAKVSVTGLGAVYIGETRGVSTIKLASRLNQEIQIELEAYIMSKLKGMPPCKLSNEYQKIIRDLPLADPDISRARPVDMVIGSDRFLWLLHPGQINNKEGHPFAQNTKFGWIVAGTLENMDEAQPVSNHGTSLLDTDATLRKLFELDEVASISSLNPEEQLCEQYFESTYSRNSEGRFLVRLPFESDPHPLGSSLNAAVRSLYMAEKKFQVDSKYMERYRRFMDEYEQMGHMSFIPDEEVSKKLSQAVYIPHFAVVNESSTTTKQRTVFNASRKTSSGYSLNDNLMVGPVLQDGLWSQVVRFRTYKIAIKADIEKMFRQIVIVEEDRDFQRIVWRYHPGQKVKHFKLNTVVYGTASAPYLAQKSLQKLADLNKDRLHTAAEAIGKHFYMDDLLTGADDVQGALELQKEIIQVMESGCFPLRKWSSNHSAILEAVPAEHSEMEIHRFEEESQIIKTLGIAWDPTSDVLSIVVKERDTYDGQITKRKLLSEASQLFDPLGIIAPTTVLVKILFQRLWLEKDLGWDDFVPYKVQHTWTLIREEIPLLRAIQVPRWLPKQNSELQIHGFADASQDAYAAVVYSRAVLPDGQIKVNLISSKTKVAPLKEVTIPKLELCAAQLLTKLTRKLQEVLSNAGLGVKIHPYSDSTIVISWLSSPPRKWKTFVANRVAYITETLPGSWWKHVPSEQNPADCASRGLTPSHLIKDELWWNGPKWLSLHEDEWPVAGHQGVDPQALEEQRKPQIQLNATQCESSAIFDQLIFNISNYSKMIRATAFCFRFKDNLRKLRDQKQTGPLSAKEFQKAEDEWVKYVQASSYSSEVRELHKSAEQQSLARLQDLKSRLVSLNPFVDENGILRVGGRLEKSKLPYKARHQIILPKNHEFTRRLVDHYHKKHLHAPLGLMMAIIRQRFWIPQQRQLIRQILHKCIICTRYKAETGKQLMGNFPEARVRSSRCFTHCGVDFAGPILLKAWKGRCNRSTKGYIAVFVCFASKAIHLELVSELSTEAYIAAHQRFISRRGRPLHMYSDNGTNFVGAKKKLSEMQTQAIKMAHSKEVANFLALNGTTWHFIPPSAPTFGGLWEAGVKSLKHHLIRVMHTKMFTFEELQTCLSQIEALLNSRPLCAISDDVDDEEILTPAHLLTNESLVAAPEPFEFKEDNHILNRWRLLTQIKNHFWARWSKEYLNNLQQRPKWQKAKENISIGDLVLIKETNTPPTYWSRGRVVKVHPGDDGLVRVAAVKSNSKTVNRPVTKLIRLSMEN